MNLPTIRYERNLRGSMMLVEASGTPTYDETLLLHNRIPGILPMEKSMMDGSWQYWYNITGKQSLDTICELKGLSVPLLRNLILSLCRELEILDKYLVSESCLLLERSVIYIEGEDQFLFTPYPMEDNPLNEQFRRLMEELIAIVDHKDQELVNLAYGLFDLAQKDNCSIEQLQEKVMEQKTMNYQEKPVSADPLRVMPAGVLREHGTYRSSAASGPEKEMEKKMEKKMEKEKEAPEERGIKGWFRTMIDYIRDEWSDDVEEAMLDAADERSRKSTEKKEVYRELYVTPEMAEETERPRRPAYKPSPTVCLTDYQNHPEGLLLYEGAENLQTIRLQKETIIGQSRDAAVQLDRETISYMHARISCRGEEYYLEDLNSTNGTFVNNRPLSYKEEVQLKVNDIVRFADVKYRFI